MPGMSGAVINAAGIVLGGGCALATNKPIPSLYQVALKIMLGVYTLWFGLKLAWSSLSGSPGQILKELAIVLLAMTLGKMAGKVMRLQKLSNSIGQYAARTVATPKPIPAFGDGFVLATALFCVGPLAVLASVQEGLGDFSPLFVVKAATDGLAAYAFCSTFGWSVLVSALPVLAWEGTLIRVVQLAGPMLSHRAWPLSDSITAVDGLLIFCVAMLILDLKKIAVADYLPSLTLAPLLAWLLW